MAPQAVGLAERVGEQKGQLRVLEPTEAIHETRKVGEETRERLRPTEAAGDDSEAA